MLLENGHILICHALSLATFLHYDENGTLLETVSIEDFPVGSSTTVEDFARYGNSLYITAVNADVSPNQCKVLEYDINLNYVRTVFTTNPDDPNQDPDGVYFSLAMFRLAISSTGKIYTTLGSSTENLWEWDNDGNFVRLHTVDTPTGFNPWNTMRINPLDDCEIVGIDNQPTQQFVRYNPCDEILITSYTDSVAFGPNSGEYHSCGNFYKVEGTGVTTPQLHIWDSEWNTLHDFNITLPTGFVTADVARVVEDESAVWLHTRTSTITNAFSIYKLAVPSNTILVQPISIASDIIRAMHVWKEAVCGGEEFFFPFVTLIGAT